MLLDGSSVSLISFLISIGTTDLHALRYSGEKRALRDKAHIIENYLEDKAAIFSEECTQVMAITIGAKDKYVLANRALALFLRRIIDHKEG